MVPHHTKGFLCFHGKVPFFGEEEREVLKEVKGTLKGCKYTEGHEMLGRLKLMASQVKRNANQ